VLDLAARYAELGEALLPLINPAVTSKYGIEISSFVVENISVPAEVEQAIDKRSSMAAVGNLNDFVKFQMGQSMTEGGAAGGMAGTAAGLGAGLAMGQQMMAAMNSAQTTPPAAPPVAGAGPALLSAADVAKALGVSEGDVLATLEKGDLKGKKIGSAWRVTQAALDEYLKS
jgi:excisionase family DNA binding protein